MDKDIYYLSKKSQEKHKELCSGLLSIENKLKKLENIQFDFNEEFVVDNYWIFLEIFK